MKCLNKIEQEMQNRRIKRRLTDKSCSTAIAVLFVPPSPHPDLSLRHLNYSQSQESANSPFQFDRSAEKLQYLTPRLNYLPSAAPTATYSNPLPLSHPSQGELEQRYIC